MKLSFFIKQGGKMAFPFKSIINDNIGSIDFLKQILTVFGKREEDEPKTSTKEVLYYT